MNTVLVAAREDFSGRAFPELAEHAGRVVEAKFGGYVLYGMYFPQRDEKKRVFDFLVQKAGEAPRARTVACGDFNTGKHHVDEAGRTFFHAASMTELETVGLFDAWRHVNGEAAREYSWFSTAGNGFRVDHFFVGGELRDRVEDCHYSHVPRVEGVSDHSVMTLRLR